jgi:hypothetical protein
MKIVEIDITAEDHSCMCQPGARWCDGEIAYPFIVAGIEYIAKLPSCRKGVNFFTGYQSPALLAIRKVEAETGAKICNRNHISGELERRFWRLSHFTWSDRRLAWAGRAGPMDYYDLTATIANFGTPDKCRCCRRTNVYWDDRSYQKPICVRCYEPIHHRRLVKGGCVCATCGVVTEDLKYIDKKRYCEVCWLTVAAEREKQSIVKRRRFAAADELQRILSMEVK